MKRILLVVMCAVLALAGACQAPQAAAAETPTPTTVAATTPPTPTATPVPTPTATPVPTTTPEPEPTRITVMAVGDLMCLAAQLGAARVSGGYNFDYAFAEVKDILSSADLCVGNLETLIAEGHAYTAASSGSSDDEATPSPSEGEAPSDTTGEPPTEDPGGDDGGGASDGGDLVGFTPGNILADIALQHSTWSQRQPLFSSPRINGPETYLSAVVGAGFDVLTTANNHINDYGVDGITKTMEKLDAYGVYHTGAYAAEEDKAPLVVDVQGIKIGIVAYTDMVNRSGNGTLINRYDNEKVAADIAAAREAGADFIIVYMHWGTENTHKVTSRQKKIAQHLADSGADLILGSHPHCTQKFELLETAQGAVPVIYSLGNFIASMPRTINDDGVILKIELEKNNQTQLTTLESMSYIPTYTMNTSAGSHMVLPAGLASIATSEYASRLENSRERTIDVLGEEIATPE